jgi:hypothetical protein
MKILHATTHHKLIYLFLDGKDVSNVAFYAEGPEEEGTEGPGKVSMYVRDGQGRIAKNEDGSPVIERKEGRVKWQLSDLGIIRELERKE